MYVQSYSKRVANAKSDKYHSNILKRGKVSDGKEVGSLFLDASVHCTLHPTVSPETCHLPYIYPASHFIR